MQFLFHYLLGKCQFLFTRSQIQLGRKTRACCTTTTTYNVDVYTAVGSDKGTTVPAGGRLHSSAGTVPFCPKHTRTFVPARLTMTLTRLICVWCDVFYSATFRSICSRVLPVVIIISSGISRVRIPIRCCDQRSLQAKRRALLYNRPRLLSLRYSVMHHSAV